MYDICAKKIVTLAEQSRREFHEATTKNNFIETRAYHKAKEMLTRNGHVTIVGNPGAGKTRLTFQLINDYCRKNDVAVQSTGKYPVLMDSPEAVLKAMKQHDNLAIAVDDVFGKDSLSDHMARIWASNARSITLKCSPISHTRGNCLVINTRKDIFQKSQNILKGFLLFGQKNVVDLDELKLSNNEKKAVLMEFIPTVTNNGISAVLRAEPTMIGFPQCCHIIAETMTSTKHSLEQSFNNPVIPLKDELYRLRTAVPLKYVVLCLVLLNKGCRKSNFSIFDPICKRLMKIYLSDNSSQVTNDEIIEAADACCPFYLTSKDSVYIFVHHTIHDSVAECLWHEKPSFFIETCTVDVLRRLSLNQAVPLRIECNMVCSVIDRMRKEIKTGNNQIYTLIAESEVLDDAEFFTNLFSHNDVINARNSDNESFVCFLIRQKSRDFINKFILSALDKLNPKEVLAAACEGNNEKLVNALLSREVPIDTDVVFSAIKGGSTNVISKLMKKSSNLSHAKGRSKQKEDTTTNTFQEACLSGNLEVFRHCTCSYGVDATLIVDENDLLYYGIQSQNLDIVKFCVNTTANLNRRYGKFQESILHTACAEGVLGIIRYLIEIFPDFMHVRDSEGNTPLFNAVSRGHIDILYLLEQKGADLTAKGKNGTTIMHLACWLRQKEITVYMLKHYPRLGFICDNNGVQVIHYAAMGGSIEVIDYFIDRKVDVDVLDNDKNTILHKACQKPGNEEMVYYLTQKYPHMKHQQTLSGESPLHKAASAGSIQIIEHLISEGLDINQCNNKGSNILHLTCLRAPQDKMLSVVKHLIEHFPSLQRVRNNFGATQLHYAAAGGSVDVLEYLVGIGYDINDKDTDGETVLHWACREDDTEDMVRHLTKKYPELKQKLTLDSESALHKAVRTGSIPITDHLASEGLDISQCNNKGCTILHLACKHPPMKKRLSVVRHIIEHFPSLQHVRNNFGSTDLHYAAMGGSVDVLEYLVGIGYDINDTNTNGGENVLHKACRHTDNENIVRYLTQTYPELKHQLTVNGESALHKAVRQGSIPNLEILISEGLDINHHNNKGSTILHLACECTPFNKRLSVVRHIIEHFPSLQHVRNKFGATELHYAAYGGSVDVLEYLVGIGYDINDTDTDGETVLHKACKQTDNEDMVRHLTQKYPELKHQLTLNGESALHKAVVGESIQVIEHLISEGMDVYQC